MTARFDTSSTTHDMLPRIPVLHWPQRTPVQIRRSGAVLVVLGLLVLAIAGAVLMFVLDLIPIESLFPSITVTERQKPLPPAAMAFLVFIGLVGAAITWDGAFRLFSGQRNPRVTATVLLVLTFLFAALALAARALL
jgi:apolipoprotein N-acyltransferase